ncbi:uncharacterized protein LOC114942448 [Nylanderia fulva]|uniref:uncharacterized protein LOC114942448 n=1 Tax=Nylanderia fulva TaxID=613905 RepID=UPI0010FAE23F|nr:uncharacterized protein LOC114942448 [Nylanderia fulva]
MDARRALPFFLLVICAISAASIIRNGRGDSNNIRRIRRINLSEYLVPPPPPRFHSPNRIPRLVNLHSVEAPGYFAQLMNWLNPFASGSPSDSSKVPPLSPPPPQTPLHAETAYPPPNFIPPPPPASGIYGDPSPATYDKPPPPLPSLNNHQGYPPSDKVKSCNPCNKVPWIPMQHGEFSHSGDASYAQPPQPLPQLPSSNGEYLPPRNREIPYDAHHAASQEVRAPDYSFASPIGGQDGSFINPLPNPQLYPGAMPPLFKAEIFNNPAVQTVTDNNSELSPYLNAPPPPSSISGDVASTNDSFPDTAQLSFNNGASVHPDLSSFPDREVYHELRYTNPDASNREFEHFNAQNYNVDLSPSGTQVSQGHSNLVADKERFDNTATQSSISHQTFGNSGDVLIDPNPPSSYGISGRDQIPGNLEHGYNDLSSSANVAEDSHAPLRATGSSVKIEDSIHFEESLLLDFTHKGESRTDSSSLPPTSNAFTDYTNTETTGTTLAPDDEIFGTRHAATTTESYFSTDRFRQTVHFVTPSEESKINDSVAQGSNGNIYDHKALRGQDVSYIPPSDQVGYLWSSVASTTSRSTEDGGLWDTLNSALSPYDDVEEETLNESVSIRSKEENTSTKQQGAKRNKKVQLIIPYTSQYTPLPFHSSHEREHERKTLHVATESNHDKYLAEESRNRIKVTSPPNSSYIWPTTSVLSEDITRKVGTKVNNSIDVHKLQKNIDNWTIQEYSRGTTVSTISPSSANPYLFPSKQIPSEYLTTTEPVNHGIGPYDDNVKTFTLAGFTFNDLDYKGSASNRVEGPRVQVMQVGNAKSTESPTDSSTASTKDDVTWQGFSVDVSSANKERVYVVTPQPITTTTKSNSADRKKEKAAKEADRNSKALATDTKKTKKKSNSFESIEKAYQVLPQAVNNLAVASTGPDSVPLWGIMEHEEFASLDESEHESEEDSESLEVPVLYTGHSKVSRARR